MDMRNASLNKASAKYCRKSFTETGIVIGTWGAVQATAAGIAVFMGGALRDITEALILRGGFTTDLFGSATPYGAVYHLEIIILFASLIALGPLVRRLGNNKNQPLTMQLADFPS